MKLPHDLCMAESSLFHIIFATTVRLSYDNFFEKKPPLGLVGVSQNLLIKPWSHTDAVSLQTSFSTCLLLQKFAIFFLSPKDSRREIHNDHAISYVETLGKPVNQVFILSFESV